MRALLVFFTLSLYSLIFYSCSEVIDSRRIDPPFGYAPREYEPAWSPDGQTIAFTSSTTSEGAGLYLIDTNGANLHRIVSGLIYSPAWSPDGQWIAYCMGQEIYKVKYNGDSLTQLTSTYYNIDPTWSPDGEWIAYCNHYCGSGLDTTIPPNSCGMLLMRKDGSDKRFINRYYHTPDWYSSGSKIICLTAAGIAGVSIGDSLWSYDISTGQKSFIYFLSKPQNLTNRFVKISPDNNTIVFTSQRSDSGHSHAIWSLNADGTNLRKLAETCSSSCDWSPMGDKIVYGNCDENNGHLWIMNKNGSNKKQLTY